MPRCPASGIYALLREAPGASLHGGGSRQNMFWGTVVYAVVNSVILALVALGFNLTFGISGVANFAYGALYILAAYLCWIFLNLLGFPYFLFWAL